MRPVRVELEGIGSFRERTVLDLDGVDLFVLSGPTGAGKTTLLVDAMTLALYGTVPRYDDRRLVAPVISQGANEGRVRFTFAVDGRTWAATRVVRRTKQGATTKEARLEDVTGGGSVVRAGTADEVTSAVGRLLGLSFDQFCRSVILPQGAFDRFLFAKPADRADLLVQLLDLGVHEQVGRRARARAEQARARLDAAERRLQGDLAGADPLELPPLVRRIGVLQVQLERCREVQRELDELREQGAHLRAEADRAAGLCDALRGLERPDGLDELGAQLRELEAQLTDAELRATAADREVEAATAARDELPDPASLAAAERAGEDRDRAAEALPEADAAAAAAEAELADAAAALSAATGDVTSARAALEEARRRELVHTLTDGLHLGDGCPVCARPLEELPDSEGTETAAAEAALDAAQQREADARSRHDRAAREQATAATRRHGARTTLDEAVERHQVALTAVGVDDAQALTELRDRLQAAEGRLSAARAEQRVAAERARGAREGLGELRARTRQAWSTFDRARDAVAALQPPSPDRDDVVVAWDELLRWADRSAPAARARADEAAAAVEQVADAWRTRSGQLRQECADLDIDVPAGQQPTEAVAETLANARARHDRLEERVREAQDVAAERDRAREEVAVADHLGRLLRADGFERWLLARALGQLVDGASRLLRELTSGAYSLDLDATNQFLVLDHRSADEPRTVKSLSGGERFLASLALALALAEHVAHLAADGAARLESLFLDEGFGTLDPDTLDVVAAALEELGARGRVVGLVTHVRELAERLPVRFEVRKGPAGSTVTRHDADAPADQDVDVAPPTGRAPR